ncbi:MAG: hypothetical protein AAB459_00885 [Patescibacteria group bacterium]
MKKSLKNLERKRLFVGVLAATLLFSSSVVFALNSSNFFSEASTFAYKNCRAVSESNNLQNVICFLIHANSESQLKFKNLNDSNDEQTVKMGKLNIYDNDHNLLGRLIDANSSTSGGIFTVYNDQIGRIISFEHSNEGNIINPEPALTDSSISFTSTDCTGDKYIPMNTVSVGISLIKMSDGFYKAVNNSRPILEIRSQIADDGNDGFICFSSVSISGVVKIVPVAIPFPNPVILPFQFES